MWRPWGISPGQTMACNLAAKLRHKPVVAVDISAIDLDDLTFAVSTVRNQEALADSLEFAGLLHAVWLKPNGAKYQIISGFLRTRLCLQAGWETITVLVLPDDLTDLELAQLAILDNLAARNLNAVEEARAVALLQKFSPETEILRKNLRVLGLSENPKHLAKLEKLLHLPIVTQKAVAADLISLAVACELAAFDEAVALRFTEIFIKGKVGLNRQRELIRLVFELSRLKELEPLSVLALPECNAIWQGAEDDQRRKALLLLEWLYQTRYPHIALAREQARQKIADLKLDERIRLNMPENFENLRHSLSFGFESRHELLEILDFCLKMANEPVLEHLFVREEA